jgi:serine/threonine protein kinase
MAAMPHDSTDLRINNLPESLRTKYTVERRLPSGTFGPAWLLRDNGSNSFVVLRYFIPGPNRRPGFRSQMKEMADAIGRSQNAVRVIDISGDDNAVWLIREWIDGENLADALRTLTTLTHEQARSLLSSVCNGLLGNTQEPVVHGALNPSNILIDRIGRVSVSDHGLGMIGTRPAGTRSMHYLAPEVVAGDTPTAQSDVYSLGAILYVTLCGAYPLAFGEDPLVNDRILAEHRIVPPPRGVRLAGGIGNVVWRSFQPRVEDRFQSMSLLLDAIKRIQGQADAATFPRLHSRLLGD